MYGQRDEPVTCATAMRTHGWGGSTPVDDEEAAARIVEAALALVRRTGAPPGIAQVAEAVSVTRQTVYRYFPSADALLAATAAHVTGALLDAIAERLAACTTPTEVAVEAVAFIVDEVDRRPELSLALAPTRLHSVLEVTSPAAVALGASILRQAPIDWAASGYDDAAVDALASHLLRIVQSLVLDPGDPPLRGAAVRAYLRRWVAPAV